VAKKIRFISKRKKQNEGKVAKIVFNTKHSTLKNSLFSLEVSKNYARGF